ncbi:MAG TPA: hypothetical protein VN908_02360 [Gemmatimonadales bacterium]|nr:hypothetical protein [Gemmatimonadales bacterium]
MHLLALLVLVQAVLAGRPVAPYLAFPEAGLDDPASYAGYATRLYRDSRGNTVQIYLDSKTGRVVHLWADALNESIGFTARDMADQGNVSWGPPAASVATRGARRTVTYRLTAHGIVRIGHFLLGSMRIERDFQYAGHQHDSLNAPPFVVPEFTQLAERLDGVFRDRLTPHLDTMHTATRWTLRVTQPSLDGKNHLWLTLGGDARRSSHSLKGGVLTIRPRGADSGPIGLTVEIATDGRALTPLTRDAIFAPPFLRFADAVHSPRLEREIRGFELLSSREKLMAGLPNYATYFGRDMLMTALLMQPIWSDTMAEFVIAAALAKLGPAGDVSHEEALGGQAIRENGSEYLTTGDARLLRNLQRTRENYWMVDDDFQLPVVAGRYFGDANVSDARKRRFVARWGPALRRNLAFVWRQAAPYAREPVATNLVSFKRDDDGWWHPGSWRDSRVGYAGGRFAFDVNVVWVPAALRAIGTIDRALRALGEPGIEDASGIAQAAETWRGTARHFAVTLAPAEVESRVGAKLASLPEVERAHWQAVLSRTGFPTDTLRFPALSLDSAGHPIAVMSTDPAMWLLLDTLGAARERELLRPFLLPYPLGLFIDGVGPVATNDAYAPPAVWDMFERDLYHSPRVVWGREVNVLLAALARRDRAAALDSVSGAVERSGLRHAELWSYRFEDTTLRPFRYGSSSDVQLWSLTDLAVQYLLNSRRPTQ